jgi:hypothetical protein
MCNFHALFQLLINNANLLIYNMLIRQPFMSKRVNEKNYLPRGEINSVSRPAGLIAGPGLSPGDREKEDRNNRATNNETRGLITAVSSNSRVPET